jgi:YbbR domain-containing protein
MKAILIACLLFVSVSVAGAITISDPNANPSEQQRESISVWLNVLAAVYDNDTSLIPDEPNEILTLETSENPRDLTCMANLQNAPV